MLHTTTISDPANFYISFNLYYLLARLASYACRRLESSAARLSADFGEDDARQFIEELCVLSHGLAGGAVSFDICALQKTAESINTTICIPARFFYSELSFYLQPLANGM